MRVTLLFLVCVGSSIACSPETASEVGVLRQAVSTSWATVGDAGTGYPMVFESQAINGKQSSTAASMIVGVNVLAGETEFWSNGRDPAPWANWLRQNGYGYELQAPLSIASTIDSQGCDVIAWRSGDSGTLHWGLQWYWSLVGFCQPGIAGWTAGIEIDSGPAVASYGVTEYYHCGVPYWYSYCFGTFQHYEVFARVGSALVWQHFIGPDGQANPASGTWTSTSGSDSSLYLAANSSPAAISRGESQADVFVRDSSGNIRWNHTSYGSLGVWTNLSKPTGTPSDPTAGSAGASDMSVCITSNSEVYCKRSTDGSTFPSAWQNCGAPPNGASGAPSVTHFGGNRVIYVRNSGSVLYYVICN